MKQILTLIIGLASLQLTAQTTLNFHSEMFDNLDTSKLSTNILDNKAGIPDPIFGLNGNSTCDASNFELWQYLFNNLNNNAL